MKSLREKKFNVIIGCGRMGKMFAANSEGRHEGWSKQERDEAFRTARTVMGRYVDIDKVDEEFLCEYAYELVRQFFSGETVFELNEEAMQVERRR